MILAEYYIPIPSRPKPRMTVKSKWQHVDYFDWANEVRQFVRDATLYESCIGIEVVLYNPNLGTDGDNHQKAILDALKKVLFKNDNLKHVCTQHITWRKNKEPGFVVRVLKCQGHEEE